MDAWSDPFYWHMYKYALNLKAVPWLAHNAANIIKSIYGKNKKSLVLDLDNTLWGGVVGDDGVENLELGPETSMGQVFAEFQSYVKHLKNIGIVLNIDSKNEEENALAGLNHPDGLLKPEDFIVIKANWEPKDQNILTISREMNVLPDSLVFVDDNPAEREIVRAKMCIRDSVYSMPGLIPMLQRSDIQTGEAEIGGYQGQAQVNDADKIFFNKL